MNLLMNLLWIVFGGLVTCVEYIVASLLLMLTIVGIPFGLQTLKLSLLAFARSEGRCRPCPMTAVAFAC